MTLAELGAQLQEERLNIGMTIEDVAARLKIPSRILHAIESGAVRDLPHTVYTRGFIKGYGVIIGYSNEKISELLDNLEGFDEEFSPHKTVEVLKPLEEKNHTPHSKWPLVVLLLIALAAAAYVGYNMFYAPSQSQPVAALPDWEPEPPASASVPPPAVLPSEPELPPVTVQTTTPPPAQPDAVPLQIPVASTEPQESTPADSVTTATAQTTPPTGAATSSEAAPVTTRGFASPPPGATPPPTPARTPPPPAGMQQIVLTAEADCWVHASADGTETREFTLKNGETFALPFKRSLQLKLGNAGGVRITYNGQLMPPAGDPGQVKTISFPPQA